MNTYKADDCAVFFRVREEFGELSNMSNDFPLVWNGYKVGSSEALYQAQKFLNESIHHNVLGQRNAFVSKTVARMYPDEVRSDWHEIKVDVMLSVLRIKYEQHRDVLNRVLDATGDRPIVEKSRRDNFWGAINDYKGNLVGKNVLGQLWMMIRDQRA